MGGPLRKDGVNFLLGFNLESFPFGSAHYRPEQRAVRSAVERELASQSAVVLRYPGGSIADRIDLIDTVGPTRKPLRLADWAPVQPLSFGLHEYGDFVGQIGARAWLVLNVIDADRKAEPSVLAERNAQGLATLLARQSVSHAELGNEPYMPKHGLDGRAYGQRVVPTLRRLERDFPTVRPVVAALGFSRAHMAAEEFNLGLVEAIGNADVDFALHFYYDGPPGVPPVERALRTVCTRIEQLRELTGRAPAVWITEHGRWPGGRVGDEGWRELWPNTNNMGAALSVAEFIIGASQIPEVRGLFQHALASPNGPWPMFHRGEDADDLFPSAPMLAQSVLYPLVLGRVSSTLTRSLTQKGVRQMRAAYVVADDGSLGLAVVHRGRQATSAVVQVSELAGQEVVYRARAVVATHVEAFNTPSERNAVRVVPIEGRLSFDADGRAALPLPAEAVVFYTLHKAN